MRIARITTPLWVLMILVFILASYLDSERGTASVWRLTQTYGLGFLAWLVAAPITVFVGFEQSRRQLGWFRISIEICALIAGITLLILAIMAFVIAPYWGVAPADLFAGNRLREWIWDLLIFAVALLSGHVLGTAYAAASPDSTDNEGGKILVRSASRVDIVDIDDIVAASAQGNYVALVTDRAEYLHRTTLGEMKQLLAQYGFVQVHRSHLVRTDAIESVKRGGGVPHVLLQGGKQIPVSHSGRQALSALFEIPSAAA
jgi:LytTr DNA-binding domain-containing protein